MPAGEPERITGCSVYPYDGEVVVELTGVDDEGVIVVVSYQFEALEGCTVVGPKGSIDSDHVTQVRDGLTENGYEWVDCPTP